jgi:hypothetical protein
MGTTRTLTLLAVFAGLAGAAPLLLAPRRWWFTRVAVGASVVAAAIVGLALLVLIGTDEVGRFGALHLAYLALVVALPMLGLAVLARMLIDRALARRVALPVAAVLLLPAAVGGYATHVEPYRLRIDRATVALDPERAGAAPIRIGVLADLQTADVRGYEHRAVDRLVAERPDLILVAGDLFQGAEASFAAHEDELRVLLGRLRAPHGCTSCAATSTTATTPTGLSAAAAPCCSTTAPSTCASAIDCCASAGTASTRPRREPLRCAGSCRRHPRTGRCGSCSRTARTPSSVSAPVRGST